MLATRPRVAPARELNDRARFELGAIENAVVAAARGLQPAEFDEHGDGLPAEARSRIYWRLWQVLNGRDASPEFGHLSDADRQAVLEILRETKEGLPGYWRE